MRTIRTVILACAAMLGGLSVSSNAGAGLVSRDVV